MHNKPKATKNMTDELGDKKRREQGTDKIVLLFWSLSAVRYACLPKKKASNSLMWVQHQPLRVQHCADHLKTGKRGNYVHFHWAPSHKWHLTVTEVTGWGQRSTGKERERESAEYGHGHVDGWGGGTWTQILQHHYTRKSIKSYFRLGLIWNKG